MTAFGAAIIAQASTITAGTGLLLLGQIQTDGVGDSTSLTIGAAFTSMMAFLGYLVRKMAGGELVSIKVADLIADAAKREDKLSEALEAEGERSDTYRQLLFTRKDPHL